MSGDVELTVVVPAFNEEERLRPTLARMEEWFTTWGRSYEVIVVDDGSADGTVRLAEEFAASRPAFRVLALGVNRGKGAAVREGFRASRGALVLFSDADLSTPIEELARLKAAIEQGADFVLGSRAVAESNLEVRQAWYRERMGKMFNAFVRLLSGIPIHDTQCGFKLLRGNEARALAEEMREDGFSFDVELVLLAARRGLRLRELGVTWRNDTGSRVNAVRDSFHMLVSLVRIVRRVGRFRAPVG